jgi:hypothetical protein
MCAAGTQAIREPYIALLQRPSTQLVKHDIGQRAYVRGMTHALSDAAMQTTQN